MNPCNSEYLEIGITSYKCISDDTISIAYIICPCERENNFNDTLQVTIQFCTPGYQLRALCNYVSILDYHISQFVEHCEAIGEFVNDDENATLNMLQGCELAMELGRKLYLIHCSNKLVAKWIAWRQGTLPWNDDLERATCKLAGTEGHMQCGICANCNRPKTLCKCIH